jgi:aerobic-type carbon monoxide dehydrogenase small subunit (CoxS/CutS family)
VNDCQIDSCDHYSVHLNSEAVSAQLGLSVAAVVATVATESEIETENAETAVRMGQDYLLGHLNLR